MNALTPKQRARILACLVEGCSMRATQRMTGFAKRTVERVLREAGEHCAKLMADKMVALPCTTIQADEIWAFVGCKDKHATQDQRERCERGDVWTWVAIDPKTKLIPCWYVGDRSAQSAYRLSRNLQPRLANRVQLTTDVVKVYGNGGEGRYSPGDFCGTETTVICGTPNPADICTSHVERQNLTIRMGNRRFTRLTNAFSKSVESHCHSLAIHFAHYNFCRIHQTIRCTPAMEAKLTDRVWELEELLPPVSPAQAAA